MDPKPEGPGAPRYHSMVTSLFFIMCRAVNHSNSPSHEKKIAHLGAHTSHAHLLVFLSSRVTGACPVTTDLIMRVNVRTTTPTTTTTATTATTSTTTTIIDHVACVVLDVFTRSCGVCVRRSVQFSNDNGTGYNQPRVSAGGSHIYAHCIFSSIVLEW